MLVLESIINGRCLRLNLRSGEILCVHMRTGAWTVKTPYRSGGYLQMKIGKKLYRYHRVTYKLWNPDWNIDDGSQDNSIDHINGNTTDNRIQNLRNVTNQQNCFNRTKSKGYHWHKKDNKWHAQIKVNGKNIHLGRFVLEEDARQAYVNAKDIYHVI
jgi:hypothetical protein